MHITAGWADEISSYLGALRAGGSPETTINTRRQHLQHMARRINREPFEITTEQLVEWAGAQKWAPATRRSRRTTLQSFYRWAKASGRTKRNPAKRLPKVRATQAKARPCPDRVYAAALLEGDSREKIMLRLAGDHGLRRAEVAGVHTRDLVEDLLGWSLLVHGKGRRQRLIPLTPRVALDIRALPDGWVFPGDDGGHLSPRWIGKLITNLLEGSWTMHTLRHRFATRAYRVDRDVFTVQQLLGHASPATTQGYVELADDSLRATVLAAAS